MNRRTFLKMVGLAVSGVRPPLNKPDKTKVLPLPEALKLMEKMWAEELFDFSMRSLRPYEADAIKIEMLNGKPRGTIIPWREFYKDPQNE